MRCSDLLLQINPHMAIYILRLCLFSPKLLSILRCSPIWKFTSISEKVDQLLKDTVGKVLNITFTPSSWSQAILPIKYGGLGIRSTGGLALPAFLSSVHSTLTLIGGILRLPSTADVPVAGLANAESAWVANHPGEQLPTEKASQAAWDSATAKTQHEYLIQSSLNVFERARLLAVSEPESGHCYMRCLRETLDRYWTLGVGLNICEPHACSRCGNPVDTLGRYSLHCQQSSGRLYRHATINELIRRALSTASLPATLEPSGLSAVDGKKPDGCTLVL